MEKSTLLQEAHTRYTRTAFLFPPYLQKQAIDVCEIKNPVHFRSPGFL